MDDTNLLAWGPTAAGNCRQLEAAYEKCLEWARRHGAVFAPDKYKLTHFTRRRNADVQAGIRIPGFEGRPVDSLQALGVWVDRKLRWTKHLEQAARRGAAQFEALGRILGSTWELSFAPTRLLYTAVVRAHNHVRL